MVNNPHTGKWFCKEKCWLRGEPIKEVRTIPILRLDERDKEEIMGALRELWKQGEETKEIIKAFILRK